MTDRVLKVWWNDAIAGTLIQDRHGDLGFIYDSGWLHGGRSALSRSLPLREEPFSRAECRPFFGGLLPEAGQRELVAGALGVSSANEFALLDRLGGDVAGALMLLHEGERPPTISDLPEPQPLTEDALAAILDRIPRRPLLAGEDGMRLSLAGAQAKLPVILAENQPALPSAGQATTHIIKPEIERFPGSVENEAWCMALAASIGIPTARAEARSAGGRPYLLVERYDRTRTAEGTIVRIHQEDACQALGTPPERKYASEGGPAFRDLFELIRTYVRQPALAVLNVLDIAIFNLVVGNADAHGKNFSFLLDEEGPRLAPFYDLLSTIHWPELSFRMAMRYGDAGTIDELGASDWKRFSEAAGITERLVRQRVKSVAESILKAVDPGSQGSPITKLIAERTNLRASRIRASIS